jgi:excisionase family DNA binding protein
MSTARGDAARGGREVDRELSAQCPLPGIPPLVLPSIELVDQLESSMLPALIATCAALQARAASRLLNCTTLTPRAQEPEHLLTVPEAAMQLGFASSYAYELVKRGALAAVRRGRYVRIRPTALAAFIAAHEHEVVDSEISDTLSYGGDRRGRAEAAQATRAHAGRTGGTTRRTRNHRLKMGNRRTQGSRAGGEAAATPREDGAQ